MTSEAQNIAEFCGWTRIKRYTDGSATLFFGHPPDKKSRKEARDTQSDPEIPQYTSDLNAIHEAEMRLSDDKWNYMDNLLNICFRRDLESDYDLQTAETNWAIQTASASQRAEALLRTISKWEES